jgi:hypothetical protein
MRHIASVTRKPALAGERTCGILKDVLGKCGPVVIRE